MGNPFLNTQQVAEIQSIFSNHFSQFASGNNNYISVVKQPISIINNQGENVLAGFGAESMNQQDITYQPVTGVYPAIIVYPKDQKKQQFGQLKFDLNENQVQIKVEEDCKNYLLNGKTERIIVNGTAFNMETAYNVQNMMGLKYYYFKLTITK